MDEANSNKSKNDTIKLDDSDSEDVSCLPSREECQSLTEQFADVTGTDTALAQFFLQERDWNLERSVNAFFESRKDGVQVLKDEDEPELLISFDSKMVPHLKNATVSTVAPTRFKLLTWNIDGLESSNLKKRTKAIIKIIESERVDIVFLQEVVPVVYSYMEEHLPQYMFISAGREGYFTAMLLLRTTVYFDSHKLYDFPSSVMSRNLLLVEAHIGLCKLRLLTSHMESTAEYTEARQTQLRTALGHATSAPPGVNSILAGDFNLRDKEVAAVGLPNGVVDVWEHTGARKEVQYTWDLSRNTNKQMGGRFNPRCRFDRVYLRCGNGSGAVKAQFFGLVGLQKVFGTQSFPSDHWGVLTHYDINT